MSGPKIIAHPRTSIYEIRTFRLPRKPGGAAEWLLDRRGEQIKTLFRRYLTWIVLQREVYENATYSSIWIVGPRGGIDSLLKDFAKRFGRFEPYPLPDADRVRSDVLRMLSKAPGKSVKERDLSRSIVSMKLSVVVPHFAGTLILDLMERLCGDIVEIKTDAEGDWSACLRESIPAPKRPIEELPETTEPTAKKKIKQDEAPPVPQRKVTLAEMLSGSIGEQLRARALCEGRTVLDLLEIDENGVLRAVPEETPPPAPKRTYFIFGVEISPQILSQ